MAHRRASAAGARCAPAAPLVELHAFAVPLVLTRAAAGTRAVTGVRVERAVQRMKWHAEFFGEALMCFHHLSVALGAQGVEIGCRVHD